MKKTKVEFIFPTFDRNYELRSALHSILAQTNPDWKVNVVVDNPFRSIADVIVDDIDDPRVYITHLDDRYNNWGHTPREKGKQMSMADYVIMTGDDGYYMPTFVEELHKMSKDSPGMIYWDMVHSHYDYQYFKCVPAFNQIDMGAFATRTDLAQQIKLNTSYAADGEFVEDFKKKFPSEAIVKINKVLFVHN